MFRVRSGKGATEFPFSWPELEQYRIVTRRQLRPGLIGGHQVRRKGQSLEFREFVPYQPGDDIRYVDWRASARFGTEKDLLVRQFVAEEQMTLAISVDTRETMHLPDAIPKIQVGLWLAEALTRIGLATGDRVILHRLFGDPEGSVLEMASSAGQGWRSGSLATLDNIQAHDAPVNLNPFYHRLHPAAVWVIITDLYLDPDVQGGALTRAMANAQDGWRWVILVDLDSWPYEKEILGTGSRCIHGPGLEHPDPRFRIDAHSVRQVESVMTDHKRQFFSRVRRAAFDRTRWEWPADRKPDAKAFFRTRFIADAVLRRLFMKDRP